MAYQGLFLLHILIHGDLRFISSKLSAVWGSAVRDHRPEGRAPDLDCKLGLRFRINRIDWHDPLWFNTDCAIQRPSTVTNHIIVDIDFIYRLNYM